MSAGHDHVFSFVIDMACARLSLEDSKYRVQRHTIKAFVIVPLFYLAAMMRAEAKWTLDTHDLSVRISLA